VPVSVFVTTISFAIYLVCWLVGSATACNERLFSSAEGQNVLSAVNPPGEAVAGKGGTMSALTTSHWIPDGSGPPLLEGATVGNRLR